MKHHAEEMGSILKAAGAAKMPVGIDIIEPPMMFELEKAGLKIKDAQHVMLEAGEVKSADEIALLNRAAAMLDGAYQLIDEKLKPGVRESDIVDMVNEFLYRHGSDDVDAINAITGEPPLSSGTGLALGGATARASRPATQPGYASLATAAPFAERSGIAPCKWVLCVMMVKPNDPVSLSCPIG